MLPSRDAFTTTTLGIGQVTTNCRVEMEDSTKEGVVYGSRFGFR